MDIAAVRGRNEYCRKKMFLKKVGWGVKMRINFVFVTTSRTRLAITNSLLVEFVSFLQ